MLPDLVERVTRDRPRVVTVPSCVSYSARLSARPEFAPRVVDAVTGGAALGDHEQARAAALGEAVERYCGNAVPDTLRGASYRRLRRAGVPAVDPREFALYAPSQYAHRGFPFVPFTSGLEIAWVPGTQGSGLDRLRVPDAVRLPGPVGGGGLADGLRLLTEQGFRAVAVDLTTPEVRAAGLHVTRVLVPGLSCNAPAAFPFLGGRRLYEEPVGRGWVAGPLREDDLVLDPLPFS
ncbi:YcaO-like family protein [Streptomyces sp. NPDC058953]|uniref:YcaO-like family protein n=1 Tax=Streptomyces sp. NPDC058953 TaxID=3346676 RepID=UPI0036829383